MFVNINKNISNFNIPERENASQSFRLSPLLVFRAKDFLTKIPKNYTGKATKEKESLFLNEILNSVNEI